MTSKTIKISEENYKWLLRIATEVQKRKESIATFDDALIELKQKKEKGDILKLAGAWKNISDKEADKILSHIYTERKVMSRRLK